MIQTFHPLSRKIAGMNRRTSIAYFSTKRNRNEHISPARGRKPLPMGEVSAQQTERASPFPQSICTAISRLFVRAILSQCRAVWQRPCPLSRACARQGRVAAPSVCFAVACILLAAAPTAPPCFRRWRRSSPLPQRGSPWHVGQLSSGRAKHDVSETVVLRCLGQQQLDKVRLSRSRCPL